jgi:hypothetical protein
MSYLYIEYITINNKKGRAKMNSTEKIKDMIKLLNMNEEYFQYELTILAAKVNNFLDDRTRFLSGQLISVMYDTLTRQNEQ